MEECIYPAAPLSSFLSVKPVRLSGIDSDYSNFMIIAQNALALTPDHRSFGSVREDCDKLATSIVAAIEDDYSLRRLQSGWGQGRMENHKVET